MTDRMEERPRQNGRPAAGASASGLPAAGPPGSGPGEPGPRELPGAATGALPRAVPWALPRALRSFPSRAPVRLLTALLALLALIPAGCSGVRLGFPVSAASARNPDLELKPVGEDEFLKGDYKAARAPLTAAAEGGSLRAMFFLRILAEHGLDGAPADPDEAHRILTILAASEDALGWLSRNAPEADRPVYQAALATLHLRGYLAPEPDLAKALDLAQEAAASGLIPAMNLAAAALANPRSGSWVGRILGGGGPAEAWRLSLAAANRGDALAMGNAGYLARIGLGTARDPFLSASLARRAAELPQATGRCLNDLGFVYETGEAVTRDMAEAARWYAKAAAKGDVLGRANAGRLKAGGGGAPQAFEGLEY